MAMAHKLTLELEMELRALQEITMEDNGRKLAIRTECKATCGKSAILKGLVRVSP